MKALFTVVFFCMTIIGAFFVGAIGGKEAAMIDIRELAVFQGNGEWYVPDGKMAASFRWINHSTTVSSYTNSAIRTVVLPIHSAQAEMLLKQYK